MNIVKIEGEQARYAISELCKFDPASVYSLRVSFDGGGVKFKVNETVWSPPFGAEEIR